MAHVPLQKIQRTQEAEHMMETSTLTEHPKEEF
jgi:hypothetical protein